MVLRGTGMGFEPFPAESYNTREGAQLFLFFFTTFHEEEILEAGIHFGKFLITQTRPHVSSRDPLPLSLIY